MPPSSYDAGSKLKLSKAHSVLTAECSERMTSMLYCPFSCETDSRLYVPSWKGYGEGYCERE